MLGAFPLATRPIAASPALPRPYKLQAIVGEYGWTAWSFSRQAKLNAWSWHGLAQANVLAWATLGNTLYMRKDTDTLVHAMQPDVFFAPGEVNTESSSVEATTQWLDYGKPGVMKALSGMDMDVQGVTAVEIFGFIPTPGAPRDRTPTLLASIPIGDAETGWTYNGEVIPLEEVGSATEFMLRFIGDDRQEVQVNKVTLYWDPV